MKILFLLSIIFIYTCVCKQDLCTTSSSFNNINTESLDISCSIEYNNYIPHYENSSNHCFSTKTDIKIMEYNIDKSGYGGDSPYETGISPLLEYITKLHNEEDYDVIILIETSRDCIQWGDGVNAADSIAKELNMNYIYGVEYYIPSQSDSNHQCTIGNAILSKYKLENIGQLVFNNQCCNYESQIGKRLAVYGDINVNNNKFKIYSVHLESGKNDIGSILSAFKLRNTQMKEIITDLDRDSAITYTDYIIGGDFNSPFIYYDYSISDLYHLKYHDSHYDIAYFKRMTCPFNGFLSKMKLGNLDYIFSRYNNNFHSSKIYNDNNEFYGLSDHLPIATSYKLLKK